MERLSSRPGDTRGIALVLVLAALVLALVVVVGFFAAVTQDRVSSRLYEDGGETRSLVDAAVGVAVAQITDATSNPDLAWISQPGLLRTFDSNGAVEAFKLYSSDVLRVDGEWDPEAEVAREVPSDWASLPNEFVDLNRPVEIGDALRFPIADPAARDVVEAGSFDFDVSGVGDTRGNPLPMPVRWIYVLEDGQLASLEEALAPDASRAVGRIAFWADDETTKVNLNTAGDGVFYDSPVSNTQEDHRLAQFQPVAQEYQRFPGHPATTSLAAVFPELRNITDPVARSRAASELAPRIAWGGSEGGTRRAWADFSLGRVGSDRIMPSIHEAAFARDSASGSWMDGEARASSGQETDLAQLGFFLTTDSRSPELNLFNRPRITLWPFNRELLENPLDLTPEDRLLRFVSEAGTNRRKLYFQRENAWDPTHDFENIPENQQLFAYLQDLTRSSFPAANAERAGNRTFEQKFGALGRDQLVTQMFDYLRTMVNTINQAYEPVGGPIYSFPQEHDLNHTGFNDITPIMINTANGWTKGVTSGPVLNEVILQFYNAGETYVDMGGVEVNPEAAAYLIRRVQLVLVLDFSLPANNLLTSMPRFQVRIDGDPWQLRPEGDLAIRRVGDATWSSNLLSLGFPGDEANVNVVCNNDAYHDNVRTPTNVFGGSLGVAYGLRRPDQNNTKTSFLSATAGGGKTLARNSGYQNYPFVSDVVEFRIPLDPDAESPPEFAEPDPRAFFQGGAITIRIYPGLIQGAENFNPENLHPTGDNRYLQEISLSIVDTTIPLPQLGPDNKQQNDPGGNHSYADLADYSRRFDYGSFDMILNTPRNPGTAAGPNSHTEPMDVFRSYHLAGDAEVRGDFRLVAARRNIPASWYKPHAAYHDANTFHAMTFIGTRQADSETIMIRPGLASSTLSELRRARSALVPDLLYFAHPNADLRSTSADLNGAERKNASGNFTNLLGDFSNGYGWKADGAFVKGPDLGAISQDPAYNESPYFKQQISRGGEDDQVSGSLSHINFTGLLYSPWKQMPSAVGFGTLPARPLENPPAPWETLLFNPVPAGGAATHRGWTDLPRDHFWLDFFTMPVVEPYAITENFATNGKINLNQQIAPFTYIRRETGLHALLRNQQIVAIPDGDAARYKNANIQRSNAFNDSHRQAVDVERTLEGIRARLDANDPFVSASEITEISMIPADLGAGSLDTFWNSHRLTGDDKREMPYHHLYPRVTTRSNTFQIFYWVQALSGEAGNWTITAQARGSQTIERYLDLANSEYGEPSGGPQEIFPPLVGINPQSGEPYYRIRHIDSRQFAPR